MIIKIGKIVNTHGIKGEVRIISNFEYIDRVFIKDFKLYIGENKEALIINSYRHHKCFEMVTFKGINDINEALKYKGKNVFIDTADIKLNDNEFIREELIGYNALVNDKIIGQIADIMYNNNNDLFVIKGNKEVLIPINMHFIKNIDNDKKTIQFTNVEGII